LEHEEAWREGGEQEFADFRADAVTVAPEGAEAMGECASAEVEAWRQAHAGDWIAASERMQEAARQVGKGGEATRGYRGVLLYLAGVWLNEGARGEAERARARELVRQASRASEIRGTWLREMTALRGADPSQLAAVDVAAIAAITTTLRGRLRANRVREKLDQMLADLDQSEAAAYERGLTALGDRLGAEASKPPGPGRCDSAWAWGTALWATLEAKSEEQPTGMLPLKDIRQANSQLDQLAADRSMDHAPAGSPSIIVSDRLTVDPQHAQSAHPNVYLTGTDVVAQVAADVAAAWRDFVTTVAQSPAEHQIRAHVEETLRDLGCLPTQVMDRLTQQRVRPE
jgi:hypothetical protein